MSAESDSGPPGSGVTCPFCESTDTVKRSDFGTSVMVALHYCRHCRSYFEAIKWGDAGADLDVPAFLKPHHPENERS